MPNRGWRHRRGRLARAPSQISQTVPDPATHETVVNPLIDLVRHSRAANCGRGSTPAATAKDTERARARARRSGYPYRNTERNSGAEQHFRDHQMPSRWSRCLCASSAPVPPKVCQSQRTWSGRAMEIAVCVMPSSLPPGGAVSPMPAPHRATCYLQLSSCANHRSPRERRSAISLANGGLRLGGCAREARIRDELIEWTLPALQSFVSNPSDPHLTNCAATFAAGSRPRSGSG
jgi:hypothetical protein